MFERKDKMCFLPGEMSGLLISTLEVFCFFEIIKAQKQRVFSLY